MQRSNQKQFSPVSQQQQQQQQNLQGFDESTATLSSSYTASSYLSNMKNSISRTTPYSASEDNSYSYSDDSYSYSYSETDGSNDTGRVSIISTTKKNEISHPHHFNSINFSHKQEINQKQQLNNQQQQQLPPRVPHPPVRISPSQVMQRTSGEGSESRSNISISNSSYGYSGSGSYSYSYSDETEEEEEEEEENISESTISDNESKSSVSYSYSSDYTENSDDTAKPESLPKKISLITKTIQGKQQTNFSSPLTYSYSNSTLSGESKDKSSISDSYTTGTITDSYSTGYSGSNITGNSYSYSESMTGDSINTSGTKTGESNYNRKDKGSYTSGESHSYSYSYSTSGSVTGSKDLTNSIPHRYSSTDSNRSSEESEMSLTPSNSQLESKSSLLLSSSSPSLTRKPKKDIHSDSKSSITTNSATTTSLITGSSGSWKSYSDKSQEDIKSTFTASTKEKRSKVSNESSISEGSLTMPAREMIILATPPEEILNIRSLPKSCIIPRGSINDTLSIFIDRLAEVQAESIRIDIAKENEKNIVGNSSEIVNKTTKPGKEDLKLKKNNNKEKEKQVGMTSNKITVAPIPKGYFTKKSLKFALKAVGVETAEERSLALKNSIIPLPRDDVLKLLDHYAYSSLIQRLTCMFIAHDRFRSGEVPLGIALELLGRCGIAYRILGSITLSLHMSSAKGRTPLLCVTQRLPPPGPPTAIIEGDEPPALETLINEEVIDICSNALNLGGVDVCWDEKKGDVYVGNRIMIKKITSREVARNIIVHLESLIYVCLSLETYSVNDHQQCTILYNSLISLLLPSEVNNIPNSKSIIVEYAISSLLNPIQKLEGLAAHRRLQERYLSYGEDSILHDTISNKYEDPIGIMMMYQKQEDQKIGWAPMLNADGSNFELTGVLPPSDICCEVNLKKLHILEEVPAGAICYCLVSAKKSSTGEWMQTVTIPISSIKVSKKKGGWKWNFINNNNKNSNRLLFTGGATDTIYIEACYDIHEVTGEKITWCAGHVIIMCGNAKSETLSMKYGSLLSDENNTIHTTSSSSISTSVKTVKPSRGFFCFPFRKKNNIKPARSLTIDVKRVQAKTLPSRDNLPNRYLVLRRHISLMSELREAIMSVSGTRTLPLQVLRQQQVQNILTIAANSELMDVFQILWDRTLRGKMGVQPRDISQRQKAILALAGKIVAVHNNISGDQNVIVDIVARGAAIPISSMHSLAPQYPVCV